MDRNRNKSQKLRLPSSLTEAQKEAVLRLIGFAKNVADLTSELTLEQKSDTDILRNDATFLVLYTSHRMYTLHKSNRTIR